MKNLAFYIAKILLEISFKGNKEKSFIYSSIDGAYEVNIKKIKLNNGTKINTLIVDELAKFPKGQHKFSLSTSYEDYMNEVGKDGKTRRSKFEAITILTDEDLKENQTLSFDRN